MSLLKMIIDKAAPLPELESFNSYLFVGPHPDDIEIGAGATAAKLAAAGKKVSFIICTDGRFGDMNTPLRGDELAEERRKEAIKSAGMLGVTDVRFLNYSDGGFYSCDEMKKAAAALISEIQPEVILAPDPDVISECHPDHRKVGAMCRELAFSCSNEGIMNAMGLQPAPVKAVAFYMTAKPNSYVKTGVYFKRQQEALFSSHVTQFPEGCADGESIKAYLKLRACLFGMKNFSRSAEGFRLYGVTQMHCLPEAGE